MAYKIIVLDLDGTLTNEKKEITPKTYDLLAVSVFHAKKRSTTTDHKSACRYCDPRLYKSLLYYTYYGFTPKLSFLGIIISYFLKLVKL